jgi:hypothetical protein
MELTYESMLKWMKEYFNAYNTFAQNPRTVEKMCDYFAPDMVYHPYITELGKPVTNRSDFLKILSGHPAGYEVFSVDDIAIDERKKVVTALLKAQIYDSKTMKLRLTKEYIPRYQLGLDENNTIKIKSIDFFWEDLEPGMLDVSDVFLGRK